MSVTFSNDHPSMMLISCVQVHAAVCMRAPAHGHKRFSTTSKIRCATVMLQNWVYMQVCTCLLNVYARIDRLLSLT